MLLFAIIHAPVNTQSWYQYMKYKRPLLAQLAKTPRTCNALAIQTGLKQHQLATTPNPGYVQSKLHSTSSISRSLEILTLIRVVEDLLAQFVATDHDGTCRCNLQRPSRPSFEEPGQALHFVDVHEESRC
jgi:hypothetical protein